jgi:hypothetical protein
MEDVWICKDCCWWDEGKRCLKSEDFNGKNGECTSVVVCSGHISNENLFEDLILTPPQHYLVREN